VPQSQPVAAAEQRPPRDPLLEFDSFHKKYTPQAFDFKTTPPVKLWLNGNASPISGAGAAASAAAAGPLLSPLSSPLASSGLGSPTNDNAAHPLLAKSQQPRSGNATHA
jgi:hypothetical protein